MNKRESLAKFTSILAGERILLYILSALKRERRHLERHDPALKSLETKNERKCFFDAPTLEAKAC